MLSFKTIFRYIGMLVMLEGILLLICFSMALLYHEENLETFGLTSAVTIALGSTWDSEGVGKPPIGVSPIL